MRKYRNILSLTTALLTPFSALACEYYEPSMTVIHPWAEPAAAGSSKVPMGFDVIDITQADRLIGASSLVAGNITLAGPEGESLEAIELQPGEVLHLSESSRYLQLNELTMELHFGRQYPLTLEFEQLGTVEVEFIVGGH